MKKHKQNCNCISCLNKRKEKHKNNCNCYVCRAKRGGNKGKNNGKWIDGSSCKKIKCKYCNKLISIKNKTGCCKKCQLKYFNPYTDPVIKNKSLLKIKGIPKTKKTIAKIKKAIKKRGGLKSKNNPNYKDGRTIGNYFCIDCGVSITYSNKRCNECDSKEKSRRFSGILNPKWEHGNSKEEYPKEFNKKLKTKIKKRDHYICQLCGLSNKKHLQIIGYDLIIHHIDYNKKNNDECNLITLCSPCNLTVNTKRRYWEKFFKKKILLKN